MPNVGIQELGVGVALCFALLAGLFLILNVLEKVKGLNSRPAQGTEYVTAAELDRAETRLKTEITRYDQEQKAKLSELHKYVQDRFHELKNDGQLMVNKIELIPERLRSIIDTIVTGLQTRMEKNTVDIAGLQAREQNRPNPHGDREP